MSTTDLDPAVVVRRAVDLLHKAVDATDGHEDTEPLRDALGWVIDGLTDQFADPLDTPAAVAVARALVGEIASGARDLVIALAAAMEYAREQRCLDALTPSSLTVALMAEHMIGAGWPATLDGHLVRPQDEVSHGNC